jgi:hypothetical protein
MKLKSLSVGLAALALGGCSYRAILVTDDAQRFAPVAVSSVRLSTLRDIPPGSIIVGPIAVTEGGNANEALVALSRLAAENGANLVVRVRLEQINGGVGASGLALRAPENPGLVAPASRQPPAPVRWRGAN